MEQNRFGFVMVVIGCAWIVTFSHPVITRAETPNDGQLKDRTDSRSVRKEQAHSNNKTPEGRPELADSRDPLKIISLPEGAGIIPAKEWQTLNFQNKTGQPLTVKLFFSVPKEGKDYVATTSDVAFWREVRLDPLPGFSPNPKPTEKDTYQITLQDGQFKGWKRRGPNPFAIVILNSQGKDISSQFNFQIDNQKQWIEIVTSQKLQAGRPSADGAGQDSGTSGTSIRKNKMPKSVIKPQQQSPKSADVP